MLSPFFNPGRRVEVFEQQEFDYLSTKHFLIYNTSNIYHNQIFQMLGAWGINRQNRTPHPFQALRNDGRRHCDKSTPGNSSKLNTIK
jgi:hypothetical protein